MFNKNIIMIRLIEQDVHFAYSILKVFICKCFSHF